MTSEEEVLKKNNINIRKINYKNGQKIIESDTGKYILETKKNNIDIYTYLSNKEFINFLSPINNDNTSFNIYKYIEEDHISNEDKAVSIVYLLTMLHTKTTTYTSINLDDIKALYEQTLTDLDNLDYYYHDMQDYIENKVYMSPEEYLLIRNISGIYNAINYSKETIKKWYQEKVSKTRDRQVLLHSNLTLDKLLISNDEYYLTDWSASHKGCPIYDLLKLFQNEYNNIEFQSLYKLYQSKYQFTHDEKLLFKSLLAKPWQIKFEKSHYENVIKTENLLLYINKGSALVLEEDKKDQETK